SVARHLGEARQAFVRVVDFIVEQAKADPNAVYAGSVPYLMLAGNLVAGWQLGRSVLVAQELLQKGQDAAFMQAKLATARFYAEHILTRVPGQADAVINGAASVMALPMDQF
ncbi:acyl-CoA dehydrogenase C-terminal domain-containing protein, partial [Comamonas sp. Y6]